MVAATQRVRAVRIGVAISDLELCAVDLDRRALGSAAWRTPLEPPSGDASSWPSLALALQELARTFNAPAGSQLAIALLPPLVEVRRLELPPLNDEELQRLLSRNAGRYFVNARAQQLVGTLRGARRARGTPSPVVAAAAPARLMALMHAAANSGGWMVETVGPAEAAWTAAAVTLWPALGKREANLLVHHPARTDLLQIEQGRLTNVRRFRAGAADAELIAQIIAPTAGAARGRVSIAAIGTAVSRNELVQSLAGRGITTVALPTSDWVAIAAVPELLAAAFADATKGPFLRSGDARAASRTSERRFTAAVIAAAIVLVMLSGVFELWGVRRKLRAVEAERATLAPAIKATLVGRTSVETAYQRLAELTKADRTAPHWSTVLAALSEHLSNEAYLTAFRGRDDSLSVDGLALRATQVFDDLEQTPGLTNIRAVAPVRRDAEDKGEPMEHFSLAAHVGGSSPAVATIPLGTPGRIAP